MTVAFLDPHQTYAELREELDAAYHRVMNSGTYILGETVSAFENNFAHYCGAKHCIGVANGLDALTLALRALDIGPGDEVIVPSHTFIATWLAVSNVGATPVPVEVMARTYNLDADKIQDAITDRTRAIIPVHLYGQPADMDAIKAVADKNDLPIIEDSAQAHGARHHGRHVGETADASAWSFYPGKNLGAFGDGGAITTNNDDLAEKLRMLRNYGSRQKYAHEMLGLNSRLDPLQAAFLDIKLRHLDTWNRHRQKVAAFYLTELSDLPVILPEVPDWASPVWHLFVIRHHERDKLKQHLDHAGITTLIHYPTPPHLQRAYASTIAKDVDLSLTETLAQQVLSLPMGPHLSDSDCEKTVSAVKDFIEKF